MALIRLALLAILPAMTALADDRRAEVNYMLHCQGCHLPEARGLEGRVPPMKDFVGYFLHSAKGREFLIRVPGVSQSALNDAELAELMNWLVITYSASQLPDDFEPFTEAEIAVVRVNPENDPASSRLSILADIAASKPWLEYELGTDNN